MRRSLAEAAGALVIAGVAPYGAEGLDWMAGMGEGHVEEFGAAIEGEEPLRRLPRECREEFKSVPSRASSHRWPPFFPTSIEPSSPMSSGEDMVANLQEGMRVGVDGWLEDDLAFASRGASI